MDDDDDEKLKKKFVEVTRRHRLSFLQRLEQKYVKTQDQSDIIDLETMTVVKDRGHLKRVKPKPFGTLSTYHCKPGQKILNVLKRRIRVKKKITIIKYDEDEDWSSDRDEDEDQSSDRDEDEDQSSDRHEDKDQPSDRDEDAPLLSYYGIKKSTVVLNRLSIKSQTLKVGCGIDPLSFSRRQIISSSKIDTSKAKIEFKFEYTARISRYLMDIPICDLSFQRRRCVGDFQKSQKSKHFQRCVSAKRIDLNARKVYKTPKLYIQLEQEVEIEEEVEEYHLSSASSVARKSKKKEERNTFHIPFSFKCPLEKPNFNVSNALPFRPKAIEMGDIYERNLNSRNLAASAIRPLPVPKVYSNYGSRATKMSAPKHFSNLL